MIEPQTVLECYQQCVNKIDDRLENLTFWYPNITVDELKNLILLELDALCENLKRFNKVQA